MSVLGMFMCLFTVFMSFNRMLLCLFVFSPFVMMNSFAVVMCLLPRDARLRRGGAGWRDVSRALDASFPQ